MEGLNRAPGLAAPSLVRMKKNTHDHPAMTLRTVQSKNHTHRMCLLEEQGNITVNLIQQAGVQQWDVISNTSTSVPSRSIVSYQHR